MSLIQGGGTPIDTVLQAATKVKILTNKIFIIALHWLCDCGFYHLKFAWRLTVQVNSYTSNRYSGLTVDYGEYFSLTVDFCFEHGHSSEYSIYWNASHPLVDIIDIENFMFSLVIMVVMVMAMKMKIKPPWISYQSKTWKINPQNLTHAWYIATLSN